MKTRKTDVFKTLLLKSLDELLQAAGKTNREMKKEEVRLSDLIDRAAIESERSVKLFMRNSESMIIREVQEALERLERGEYGICQSCGESISKKRLLIKPAACLCTNCMAQRERVKKMSPYHGLSSWMPVNPD